MYHYEKPDVLVCNSIVEDGVRVKNMHTITTNILVSLNGSKRGSSVPSDVFEEADDI